MTAADAGHSPGYVVPDPGLQVERTGLAWVRTSAAVGVVGLLLLRWLPSHGFLVVAPTLVAFAVAAWLRVTARSHYQWGLGIVTDDDQEQEQEQEQEQVAKDIAVHATAHPARVLLLLAGVLALAAVGSWVMLTGPGTVTP